MSLLFYNRETLKQHTNWRWGEEKFGEIAPVVSDWDELQKAEAMYVIFGIPEDIGVRANYGQPGTSKAWKACLSALCNIQANEHTQPHHAVILGEIDTASEMQEASELDMDDPFYPTKIGSIVKQIDDKVSEVVQKISSLNKIPIIIGGGHNNSYGNLKGASEALGEPVNCINMDAHTDFRSLEHRHSGNGFSYAMEEGFLHKYSIFGIHQNYTSTSIYERIAELKEQIQTIHFEDISKKENGFVNALKESKQFCCSKKFGLELDLDAISYMGSSAMSPIGFNIEEARKFIRFFAQHKNCTYIHLCEGAPIYELFPNQVGKILAYLISDVVYPS